MHIGQQCPSIAPQNILSTKESKIMNTIQKCLLLYIIILILVVMIKPFSNTARTINQKQRKFLKYVNH